MTPGRTRGCMQLKQYSETPPISQSVLPQVWVVFSWTFCLAQCCPSPLRPSVTVWEQVGRPRQSGRSWESREVSRQSEDGALGAWGWGVVTWGSTCQWSHRRAGPPPSSCRTRQRGRGQTGSWDSAARGRRGRLWSGYGGWLPTTIIP